MIYNATQSPADRFRRPRTHRLVHAERYYVGPRSCRGKLCFAHGELLICVFFDNIKIFIV